jgi:hypothetical protein
VHFFLAFALPLLHSNFLFTLQHLDIPLHQAAKRGHVDVVRFLVTECDADVSSKIVGFFFCSVFVAFFDD